MKSNFVFFYNEIIYTVIGFGNCGGNMKIIEGKTRHISVAQQRHVERKKVNLWYNAL